MVVGSNEETILLSNGRGTVGRWSKREGENCWSGRSVGSPSRHRNSGCAARDRDSVGQCALRSAEWCGRFAILPLVRRDVSCGGGTVCSFWRECGRRHKLDPRPTG